MSSASKIRYGVAMSLDGYIAGHGGEFDWIPDDPGIDFATIWAQFDIFLMGRRTWEIASDRFEETFAGKQVFVASRTLGPNDLPAGINLLPEIHRQTLHELRNRAQRDIWLFGGCELAGTVLSLNEIDELDLSVIPILLGAGVPLLPDLRNRTTLKLLDQKAYPSGTLQLHYAIQRKGSLPQTQCPE